MAKHRIPIALAIERVDGAPPQERVPKADQRAVAATCIRRLRERFPEIPDRLISVSHSRGWVGAAAIPCGGATQIGLDIEYVDPSRNWRGIIGMLAPGVDLMPSDRDAARIWTCYEAAFKATGVFPDPAEIANIAAGLERGADGDAVTEQLSGMVQLHSRWLPADERFALTVAAAPCVHLTGFEIEWLNDHPTRQ